MERHALPGDDPHADAGHRVRAQVRNPALHDLAVRVPCLNCALVHPTLEVLLPLLVRKQAVQHGPQAALRRQVGDLRNGQPRERRRRVRREVREEVEQAHVVRADVDVHDGDVVRVRVEEGLADAAPVDECYGVVLLRERCEVWVEGLRQRQHGGVVFEPAPLPVCAADTEGWSLVRQGESRRKSVAL